MKKTVFLALACVLALTPACARKKQAAKILSLQKNMSMSQVRMHLGEPDTVIASYVDNNDNDIDIWEYRLGIRDEEKHTTKVLFQVGGWFLFWPLLCFPQAWRSSWTYDFYFFKFVNSALYSWGRKNETFDLPKEYSPVY